MTDNDRTLIKLCILFGGHQFRGVCPECGVDCEEYLSSLSTTDQEIYRRLEKAYN